MMNDFMIAPPSNEDSVVDWKYDMRREMQLISPNLYLGPYACARDRALLASTGITHLLAVADANEAKFMKVHDGLVYQHIKVTDSLSENLIPYFPIAKHFLDAVLSNPANKVLVYCNNGMSRSPCFVVAYLMEALKWDFTTAFGYVQNRRFCISPNDNFKMQLREYQPIYQARLQNLAQHHPTPIPYPVAPFDPNNSVPGAVHRLGAKRRQLEEDDEFADHYGDHQNAGRVGGSGSGSGGMDMSD
ncbi:phosphatases II [Rhizoclosmatium globosum]|uniref:Phosphatases II n=1 Tax=Rhizoclosmatium globosum TaxID=329046 RepID=A0A1Y2BWE1_9FUNG|nr:phosphatases II [Rhizoclosmatium globosum]|eukprot:ORY39068.1 phosphatases II [Rhizoclosmatium globosum]